LNHVYLPRHLPSAAKPGRLSIFLIVVSCLAYLILATRYGLTLLQVT